MNMEINITHLAHIDTTEFSDSIHRSGRDDIGQVTWRNACAFAKGNPLVSGEQIATVVDWLVGFGAWAREELEAMSDVEINGSLLQFVASELAEFLEHEHDADWQERSGGHIYRSDDSQLYFYVGC